MSHLEGEDFKTKEQLSITTRAEEATVNGDIDNDSVNSLSTDSIQEHSKRQQRISRINTLTEKGLAYQEERQREQRKL